jgi:hypothetical protein
VSTSQTTVDALRVLALDLSRRHSGSSVASVAHAVAEGLDEPLRIALAGRVKAGKSTLLNALVGEHLASTDAGECTRIVTWYRHGTSRAVEIETLDGRREAVQFQRGAGGVVPSLDVAPSDLRRIDVRWPSTRLEAMTLVDTPGVGGLDTAAGQRSTDFTTDESSPHRADAVLYLTSQVHPDDWRFLEAFDNGGVRPDPSCAIALLSRADEVHDGSLDALAFAQDTAHRLAARPEIRSRCHTVLPIAGLMACGAAMLTAEQHRTLQQVAVAAETTEGLVTAGRFAGTPAWDIGDVSIAERRALLDSMGLAGVRAAIAVLRAAPETSAAEMATQLRRLSGIDDLVEVIQTRFVRRRQALRARSSLRTLWMLCQRHPEIGAAVMGELERIESADHELDEIEVLNAFTAGRLGLSPDEGTDLRRWLDETNETSNRSALLESIARWRAVAEYPLAGPADVYAANTVVRSLERRILHC